MTAYEWILPVFYAVFGLLIGSFTNVCISRIPKKESIIAPPSHCPSCGERIKWYDNIPLLSYLVLRGKCRSCKTHISLQYPAVELLSGLLFLASYLRFGFGVYSVCVALLSVTLLALSVTDLQTMLVPDRYHIVILALAVVSAVWDSPVLWYDRLIGFVAGGALLYLTAVVGEKLLKKETMGGADIKLLAAAGAFLGWQLMLLALFLGSLAGSVYGIAMLLLRKSGEREVPFTPALSAGILLSVFYGRELITWYIMKLILGS